MKHLILYVAALAGLLLGGGSCSKEQTAGGTEGYGRVEMALSRKRRTGMKIRLSQRR